ncbi:MAG: hypothetical protein IJK04_15290 [Kiritimatiellae bacterium]|nr:hypothetical protein [Kiritimatiellia bacterium]
MHYAKTTATAIAVAALAAGADASIVAPMADTYLQSDGTQAIDTGYCASDKTKVVIDFEGVWDSTVTYYAFGAVGTKNETPMMGVFGKTGATLTFRAPASQNHVAFNTEVLSEDNTRYLVTIDHVAQTATVEYGGNTFSRSCGASTGTNDVTIAAFAIHADDGTYKYPLTGKIYSMQIYDDGTLVRDFIPYGFGATTGLYDRVNGKVHERTQGNPFVIGTDDAYVRGSETAPAYVNTGVTPTPDTKVEIDFAMMSATKNSRVFGNLGGSAFCMDLHVDKSGSGNFFYSMQDGNTGGYTTSFGVDGDRHVFALSTNEVLLASADGAVTNFIATSLAGTRVKTAQGPMVVFGASNSANPVSGSQFPCDVKVYRMKIWEDGVLVRDFTPFMKNGAAGFLDNCDPDENSNFHGTINANPLRYGGAMESDADPISACTVTPQGGEVPVNGTLTLTASATGATGYQWFLDGEMIEGATGSTLAVEWTKNSRLVRTYKCLAFFSVFGYAESAAAVVTNAPSATVIYLR